MCIPRFDDYLSKSDFCYHIFSFFDEFGDIETNMWSKAELSCLMHGGALASLHSSEEVTAVLKNWVSSATEIWIGLMAERKPKLSSYPNSLFLRCYLFYVT